MLTLICGHPNAGKTTYSERFENVLHFDEYLGRYADGYAIAAGMDDVVVEGLFQKRKTRLELLDALADHSPKVCIWVDTPTEVCKARPDFKGRARMEPPTLDEGWDEMIVIRGDGEPNP